MGQLAEHAVEIGGLHDLQVLVGCRILGTYHLLCGIIDGDALLPEKFLNSIEAVGLLLYIHEMELILEVDNPEYPPHIILEVGIIPGHAPPLLCRRKRAEHQQLGIARQPRLKRMILNHSTVNYKLLTIN